MKSNPFYTLFPRKSESTAIVPAAMAAPASERETEKGDLEEELIALLAFGQPRLLYMGSTWYCCIEMHVASDGVTFKVQSDFKQPSPLAAVRQCRQRIDAVLAKT